MKISRQWLQNFFDSPLPSTEEISNALTFHAFEIDGVEKVGADEVLDVKVTPNRGHDCLSHRGIAKELSAILRMPLSAERDPFAKKPDLSKKTPDVKIKVDDTKLCTRFTAAYIKAVRVGPSPEWLKTSLEAIGQRSINNVVDATNLVMFNTGQPLHAFDAGKLTNKGGYSLRVRKAKEGEKMIGLDDKEYILTPSVLVIGDENAGEAVSIAGIKGGKPTGIDGSTVDVILEAANWDGPMIRKTSQSLKLRTDASDRFQQMVSPDLAAYGLQQTTDLVLSIAGGEIQGYVDEYPAPQKNAPVSVSLGKINSILGVTLSGIDVADTFTRLGFTFEEKAGVFTVEPPFERLDILIPEDLIEEVARIVGYEKIPAMELPSFSKPAEVNQNFYAAEAMREELASKGYSEVYTSVFAEKGERAVLNKIGGEKPYLRTTLIDGLKEALEKNVRNKHLLGLKEVRLFEIGTVWKDGNERILVGTISETEAAKEVPLVPQNGMTAYQDLPVSTAERYQPFSKYPFIVRDISMWVPQSPGAFSDVVSVFAEKASTLLRHVELFDQFQKGERVSYAFRLVFQSFEKTLTDEEVSAIMESITAAVKEKGWEVR